VASSAGVEREFTSYGVPVVQWKLRNQFGTDKSPKVVFLYKFLNQWNVKFVHFSLMQFDCVSWNSELINYRTLPKTASVVVCSKQK